jgi:hypothetical protein
MMRTNRSSWRSCRAGDDHSSIGAAQPLQAVMIDAIPDTR